MEDIGSTRVVGIKLVSVAGPQRLINERMNEEGAPSTFIDGIRVSDGHALQIVKELSWSMRFEVECALAKGVMNMPSTKIISVVSGNCYPAKPIGIINGQGYGYSGKVRRIDAKSISKRFGSGIYLFDSECRLLAIRPTVQLQERGSGGGMCGPDESSEINFYGQRTNIG